MCAQREPDLATPRSTWPTSASCLQETHRAHKTTQGGSSVNRRKKNPYGALGGVRARNSESLHRMAAGVLEKRLEKSGLCAPFLEDQLLGETQVNLGVEIFNGDAASGSTLAGAAFGVSPPRLEAGLMGRTRAKFGLFGLRSDMDHRRLRAKVDRSWKKARQSLQKLCHRTPPPLRKLSPYSAAGCRAAESQARVPRQR